MKSLHQPIRECISCGSKLPKNKLLRIVKNETGIFYDETGKESGRGAYLCDETVCLEKLVKQKRLNKAFKGPVAEDVYQELTKVLQSKTGKAGH